MPALPFCRTRLIAAWSPTAYLKELKTLGDHLNKRRLDLGLQWKDVAEHIETDATSVANWRKGRTRPALKFWPSVIRFLGYDPRPPEEESVGQQLKRHREKHGWSQSDAAEKLGVSVSVLWRWESGLRKPRGRYLAKVYALLGDDPRPAPVTIGEQLRRRREEVSLTLTAMARRLGVTQSTLCRWESGEREPTGVYLARVQTVLRPGA